MKPRLISTELQNIDDRILAHGLDPGSFAYRVQASECVTCYVQRPSRVLGEIVPAEALALYLRDREDIYMTFERDPRGGFRSSFRPSLDNELSARIPDWRKLMGVLDQWLDQLVQKKGSREVKEAQPVFEGRHYVERPVEGQT